LDRHSDNEELAALLEVYSAEHQEDRHSATSALALITVGVAYITAATAVIYHCRQGDNCSNNDDVIKFALFFLPLVPVAILGLLSLNLADSFVRGHYLETIERRLTKALQDRFGKDFMIPTYVVRFRYRSNRENWIHTVVNMVSLSSLAIVVALFIIGVAMSTKVTYGWLAFIPYGLVEVLALILVLKGRSPASWRHLDERAKSSLGAP
jgi:hypothetical protein